MSVNCIGGVPCGGATECDGRIGRKETTHAETTASDHSPREPPPIMLSGPHLMLPNPGRDDDILLPDPITLPIESLDDLLRFHQLTLLRIRRLVRKRERLLPPVELVEPFLAFRGDGAVGDGVGDEGEEVGEVRRDVTLDRAGGFDDLVDVLWLDLEVEYTPPVLESSGFGVWCEGCRGERPTRTPRQYP